MSGDFRGAIVAGRIRIETAVQVAGPDRVPVAALVMVARAVQLLEQASDLLDPQAPLVVTDADCALAMFVKAYER